MSKHLQQPDTRTSRNAGGVAREVLLKANIALLLVLVIIPTISGVAWIA